MPLEQPHRYKILQYSMSEILIFDVYGGSTIKINEFVLSILFFLLQFCSANFCFHVCPTVCNFTEFKDDIKGVIAGAFIIFLKRL